MGRVYVRMVAAWSELSSLRKATKSAPHQPSSLAVYFDLMWTRANVEKVHADMP